MAADGTARTASATPGATMSGHSRSRHASRPVVALTLTVFVLLTVLALCAGAASAATSSSASPSAETLTLRLGWTESPLNLNPFIG